MLCNFVDDRTDPRNSLKVDAAVEATWHDNSVTDADQAPVIEDETYVLIEFRKNIGLAEAVDWAIAAPGPVTLFVRDAASLNPQDEDAEADDTQDTEWPVPPRRLPSRLVNIIDSRTNRFRWKWVDAALNGDSGGSLNVRAGVTVQDAVDWAVCAQEPVVLVLNDAMTICS